MKDNSKFKKEHDAVISYVLEQIGIDLNQYRDGDGSVPYSTTYWDIDGPKVCVNWSGSTGAMNQDAKTKLMTLANKSNGKLVVEWGGAWFKYVSLNLAGAHEVILHKYRKGGRRKVTIDGVEYPSFNDVLDTFNISYSTVYRFKRELNLTQEEAISYAIEYRKDQDEKMRRSREKRAKEEEIEKKKRTERAKAREFVFRGVTYRSFAECCRVHNAKFGIRLNEESVKTRARMNEESLQEQLESTIQRLLRKKVKEKICVGKHRVVRVNTREKAERIWEFLGERGRWFEEPLSPKGNNFVIIYVSKKGVK